MSRRPGRIRVPVECALDGIKLKKPAEWSDSWLDKSTLAELYDLADRWRIRGKTATAIIAKCQNKRISNTEESRVMGFDLSGEGGYFRAGIMSWSPL